MSKAYPQKNEIKNQIKILEFGGEVYYLQNFFIFSFLAVN